VYYLVPSLQRIPTDVTLNPGGCGVEMVSSSRRNQTPNSAESKKKLGSFQFTLNRILPFKSIPFYFHHPAFLPSISLSLLYLTVLSFSGQMITFLLSSGYSSLHVGITRTISTAFELSATWIAPRVAKKIGSVRSGIWFLTWQMAWLAGGVGWFFIDGSGTGKKHEFAASGLVGGVILSRVGLWGFDLSAQNIIQDVGFFILKETIRNDSNFNLLQEVDTDHRGIFSTVEASFQNLFELLSYTSTITFPKPSQFRWPVLISVAAVYASGGVYAAFVRKRRGHLLHPPSCSCVHGK
jgi:solute carrier family 40 (iron-regulated transporter), member 1